MDITRFPPTRVEGLRRLTQFAPNAGRAYTDGRNTDFGQDQPSKVSRLSPYIRYRLIAEKEVVSDVLARHNIRAAEKFVQEVLWRTYWKGWLEMRPAVWADFLTDRDHAFAHFPNMRAVQNAENGMTGIDGFDDWARELTETGYLHNHARMWFASIWIFTLRLPWSLGADFFLRNLVDADAASNTLSWRWVAGLQTIGKTYLARADNIARYTNGRFEPKGLAHHAEPLIENKVYRAAALLQAEIADTHVPSLLLVTHEDMTPESFISAGPYIKNAYSVVGRELSWGDAAYEFVSGAAHDAQNRLQEKYNCSVTTLQALDAQTLIHAAQDADATQIITPYAPVGPVADAFRKLEVPLSAAGIKLVRARREWDSAFWPHAKKGFFAFKEKIPSEFANAGLFLV